MKALIILYCIGLPEMILSKKILLAYLRYFQALHYKNKVSTKIPKHLKVK